MPGEAVFAIALAKPGPLELKLRIDDHKRLLHSLGSGYIVGALFFSYALTVRIVIPPPITEPGPPISHGGDGRTTFVPPKEYHNHKPPQRATPRPQRVEPHHERPAPAVARNAGKDLGVLHQGEITSVGAAGLTAFKLMKQVMGKLDQDKIDHASTLSHTEPTRIAAARRGVAREDAWNQAYNPDGTDKPGDGILPPPTAVPRLPSNHILPQAIAGTSIDVAVEGKLRSSESIMATIRAHSPGLRHIYNSFLKVRPGLAGKITVRFAIAPRGDVVDAALVSSTTGMEEFDGRVMQAVSAWHFEPVKAVGNDIVTVPFTFSE